MRKILTVWACFILAINTLVIAPVRAVDITRTPVTEFSNTAPLLITAYQTTAGATLLASVELYNQADEPVSMHCWSLDVIAKDGSVHALSYATAHSGVMLPGEHVTIGINSVATYQLAADTMVSAIMTIELRCDDVSKNYHIVTAQVKDTTDAPYFRTYTSTGYSTASQPFATTPVRTFYDDGLYVAPAAPIGLKIVEVYPYASDCAPFDMSVLCGDYVKLQNIGEDVIELEEYALRTDYYGVARTSSNTFSLKGRLQPGGVYLVDKTDDGDLLSLTNSGGYAWIEDAWGMARYEETIQKYEAASSDEQGYSYAMSDDSIWQWTTTPQPDGDNVITLPVIQAVECPEGKYRNPETGRCRTIEEAVNALTECEEGYERNPTTNRCRKIVAPTASAGLTPCKEGQERNPATNRCRSIASAVAELLPCDEGYERNSTTNRCRKIKNDTVPEAAFPVVPTNQGTADMGGWYAFAALGTIALGYAVWEWRVEIATGSRKLLGVLRRAK